MAAMLQVEVSGITIIADASPATEITSRLRYESHDGMYDFLKAQPTDQVAQCDLLIFQALGRKGEQLKLESLLNRRQPRSGLCRVDK